MSEREPFEGWAIVELMGHRRLAGHVSEQEIAGQAFLRLDVHGDEAQQTITQFYGAASVYCLTPTTEEIARAVGARSMPRPVHAYELEPPKPADDFTGDADDDDDDELYPEGDTPF